MLPESKSPLALAREAVELAEKATKGPWYFRCTDDAHFMNARMVSTEPTPIEHSGWTGTHDGIAREDFKEAICVTLHQLSPQICRDDGKEDENGELIAHAGSHYATVARAAIEMAALLEQTRRVHQHDAEEWCSVNDDYPEAFCTCGADAWNARIDALTKGEQ
jgi:hypothetical protein